jgi:hypothetical protein
MTNFEKLLNSFCDDDNNNELLKSFVQIHNYHNDKMIINVNNNEIFDIHNDLLSSNDYIFYHSIILYAKCNHLFIDESYYNDNADYFYNAIEKIDEYFENGYFDDDY